MSTFRSSWSLPLGLLALLVIGWFWIGAMSAATVSIAVLALYYAAGATSFNLLFGVLGIFSLAQPIFFATGGYSSVYLYNTYDLSPWIGMLVGSLVAAVLAIPIGFAAMRHSGHIITALVTLIIAQAAVPILAAIKPLGGANGLYVALEPEDDFGAMQFVAGQPYARILLVINVVLIGGLLWFKRSRFGYWAAAVHDSEQAASASGVPVQRLKVAIFVVSAAIAAPAGAVYAQYNLFVNANLFLGAGIFQVIVVALIGGAARAWGPLVGAAVAVTLTHELTDLADGRPGIGPLTFACAFLFLALVMPRGISGTWAAVVERRRPITSGGSLERPLMTVDRDVAAQPVAVGEPR